jgi:hypothetical protein
MGVKTAAGRIGDAGRTVPRTVVEHHDVAHKSLHRRGNEHRERLRQLGFLIAAFHDDSQHS